MLVSVAIKSAQFCFALALSHIIPQFGKGLVALPSSSSDAATDYVPAQDTITKTLRAPMRLGDPKSFVLQTIRADSWLSSRSSQELNKPQAFLCPSPWALNYSESSALTYPSAGPCEKTGEFSVKRNLN